MPGPMRHNQLISSPKPIIAEQPPTAPNGGWVSGYQESFAPCGRHGSPSPAGCRPTIYS